MYDAVMRAMYLGVAEASRGQGRKVRLCPCLRPPFFGLRAFGIEMLTVDMTPPVPIWTRWSVWFRPTRHKGHMVRAHVQQPAGHHLFR